MKSAIPLVVVAALLAGCGSDEGDGTDARDRPGAPARALDTNVFRSDGIAFTFEYPEELSARTKPQGEVLGQVSLHRGARLNAIKVRRTADRALGPDRYLDEFQRDFSRAVGEVEKRRERIGGLEVGVLAFDDTVARSGETVAFSSSSYFFTGAGKTWQVECIADAEHRDEIEDACRAALESVRFRKEKRTTQAAGQKKVD